MSTRMSRPRRAQLGVEQLDARLVLSASNPLLSPDQAVQLLGPQTGNFRISHMGPDGDAAFDALSTAVAYNSRDNEYLVVWHGEESTEFEFEIYGQRINAATGTPRGGRIRISDMGPDGSTAFGAYRPAVAYNSRDNEFLIVWHGDDAVDEDFEIYGQRLDAATGAEKGSNDFRISDMGGIGNAAFDAFEKAVAYNSLTNEYLVVWQGDDNVGGLADDEFEIFGQRLDGATGEERGINDFRISSMGPDGNTAHRAEDPAVVYNSRDNEYLVVWSGDETNDEFEIYGQRLDADPATFGPTGTDDFRISDVGPNGSVLYAAFNPAVACNVTNNEYLVVWQGDNDAGAQVEGDEEILGQRLDAATGQERGVNDFRISSMGADGSRNFVARDPAVVHNATANEYLVIWSAEDTAPVVDNEFEVFGQRLHADPAAFGEVGEDDFRISHMGPDGSTRFLVQSPSVASNPTRGEYLVCWASDDDTPPLVDNEYEVFGARLTREGQPAPPAADQPAARAITAALEAVRRAGRRVLFVVVRDAGTGEVQQRFRSPFQRPAHKRITVAVTDTNGDGVADSVVLSARKGRKIVTRRFRG